MVDAKMLNKMSSAPGFIAALDQSGGSTPKALRLYGVNESDYSGDDEMFRAPRKPPPAPPALCMPCASAS